VAPAEEQLPFHPHIRHALSPGAPWYRRLVALLLGGLLLTALDCVGPRTPANSTIPR
jgi:hypothetical protein